MPIWLRKFTFNQIQSFYQKETEDLEKAKQKSSGKTTAIGADGKINPAIFKRPTKSSYN